MPRRALVALPTFFAVVFSAVVAFANEFSPYWLAVRFDPNGAPFYLVEIEVDGARRLVPLVERVDNDDGTVEGLAYGGDPTSTTTVSIVSIDAEGFEHESNELDIPPTLSACQRYDLDDDGVVTSSDALELLLAVADAVCQ